MSDTTKMEIELPELPEKTLFGASRYGTIFAGYTADQMSAYALSAIEADRNKRAVEAEVVMPEKMPPEVERILANPRDDTAETLYADLRKFLSAQGRKA